MALTNNEKVGRGFALLAKGLGPWVDERMQAAMPAAAGGKSWLDILAARDASKFGKTPTYSLDDPRFLLRVVTEEWRVFSDDLSRVETAFATELRQTGNAWAHGDKLDSDDTARTLDTTERLLTAVGATEEAAAVETLRLDHQREVFEKQTRNKVNRAAAVNVTGVVAGTSIKPWRDVVTPHPDVIKAQFSSAEFAADLYAVAGGLSTSPEYSDPREFFARTYLTSGLRDLLGRAVRRLACDAGASPVVNLQTQFGGGKTHSMLALYHLFSGVPASALPQAVQDLVGDALPTGADGPTGTDPLAALRVRRVTLVGTRLSPGEVRTKADGTGVRTLWGELAWQLGAAGPEGGRAAFEKVASADAHSVPPGEALDDLVRGIVDGGERVLILVDEWVAYARLLVDRQDLPGGTFEAQFTFAQHLTELAKTTPGVMLVVSIPDSDTIDAGGGGSALEVGGPNGKIALDQLKHVIGRTADDWRPANPIESFEIVRRRLFEEPTAAAHADIAAVARQHVKFYQENTGFFPKDAAAADYETRIKAAYPIHPELFDRLYEDWSALPKFQRTRGVLRLMSQVINVLWNEGDSAPLITPGAVPVSAEAVFSEVTKYLDDNWKPVVDKDVDGVGSTPAAIDDERPAFKSRALTRRVARAVFMATVPTLHTPHKGVDIQRLRLGVAVPGDVMSHIGDARELLSQRATYFYEDGDRSWYDTAASVSRLAAERAAGYSDEDVYAEIETRLADEARKPRGPFASVHAAPSDAGDVPDGDTLRLVVLHPRFTWGKDASSATEFADRMLAQAGTAQRRRRNMIVFVAADRARYADLESAVREHKAWSSIVIGAEASGLSIQQTNQAKTRTRQLDDAVTVRLRNAYTALLVPVQVAGEPITLTFERVGESGGSLAERVTSKLKGTGRLAEVLGTSVVRVALDGPLATPWSAGHVRLGDLWDWYTQYPYLQRLPSRAVLEKAVLAVKNSLMWQVEGFALASGYDEATERYLDLWLPGDVPDPSAVPDSWLLVRPDRAVSQRARENEEPAPRAPGDVVPTPDSIQPAPDGGTVDVPTRPAPGPVRVAPHRYFGSKTLSAQRYGRDFGDLTNEVLAHLVAADGVELEVRVEITARSADGFSEQVVRTVRENAVQLKFDESGFEEA